MHFQVVIFPLPLSETWDDFLKIVLSVRICCGSVSEPYLRLQPSGDFYLHSSPLTDSNNLLKWPLMYSNQCMSLADSATGELILAITLCMHSPVQILEWCFSLQPEISDGYKNSHWFSICSALVFIVKTGMTKLFVCQNWKLEAIFKFIWTNMYEISVWRIAKSSGFF